MVITAHLQSGDTTEPSGMIQAHSLFSEMWASPDPAATLICEEHWVAVAPGVLFPIPHSCLTPTAKMAGWWLPSVSMHSCARLLGEGRKEEDGEQSQCSRFHRLQNWGLENTDSSQRVPTHWGPYRTLSFWHTCSKHWGAFKMRAAQSLWSTKWLAELCQTVCFSERLGKAGLGRRILEKTCSKVSRYLGTSPDEVSERVWWELGGWTEDISHVHEHSLPPTYSATQTREQNHEVGIQGWIHLVHQKSYSKRSPKYIAMHITQ